MPELRVGSRRCQCHGCNRYFNSVSAFDMHQQLKGNRYSPVLVCHDPAELGMVEIDGWWATGRMPKFTRAARAGATMGDERIDDTDPPPSARPRRHVRASLAVAP